LFSNSPSRLTQTRLQAVAGVTGRLVNESAAPGSVKLVPVRTCHGTDHVADVSRRRRRGRQPFL